MSDNKERLVWVDALRVLACFGVISLHIWAPLVGMYGKVPSLLWWEGNVATALIAWCVPVFVLISGAMLLGRPPQEKARLFFAKRLPVFRLIFFWTVFFVLFRIYVEHELVPGRILNVMIQGTPYYHLWFLYMITGLYLCTPILCRLVVSLTPGRRLLVALLLHLAACAYIFAQEVLRVRLPLTNILTMCLPFLGYYLIGFELRRRAPGRGMVLPFMALFMLSTAALIVGSFLIVYYGVHALPLGWLFGPFGPVVGILSVAFFQLLHAMAGVSPGVSGTFRRADGIFNLLAKLSPLTLGIYLIHPFFIRFLTHLGFPGEFVGPHLAMIINTVVVFGWSVLTVWAISRVPYVRGLVMGGR